MSDYIEMALSGASVLLLVFSYDYRGSLKFAQVAMCWTEGSDQHAKIPNVQRVHFDS